MCSRPWVSSKGAVFMRQAGVVTLLIALASAPASHGGERPGGRIQAVEATDYSRKTVYHSPQTPGYTCWVGAWPMPDDSLMIGFTRATGPLEGRPRMSKELQERLGWPPATDPVGYDFTGLDLCNVYLRSSDGG